MKSCGTFTSRRSLKKLSHVSGSLVLPDKDLAAFKTQIGRQAYCLTSAVEKELCCARHRCPPWSDKFSLIYTMMYHIELRVVPSGSSPLLLSARTDFRSLPAPLNPV